MHCRVLEVGKNAIQTKTYGTVTYMPPELLLEGRMTKDCDVYGYGVIVWWVPPPFFCAAYAAITIWRGRRCDDALSAPRQCSMQAHSLWCVVHARTVPMDAAVARVHGHGAELEAVFPHAACGPATSSSAMRETP